MAPSLSRQASTILDETDRRCSKSQNDVVGPIRGNLASPIFLRRPAATGGLGTGCTRRWSGLLVDSLALPLKDADPNPLERIVPASGSAKRAILDRLDDRAGTKIAAVL